MTLKHAIKKFLAAGLTHELPSNLPPCFHHFRNPANGRFVEVLASGDAVSTMRVRRANDVDDIQSDYFPGTWVNTVPQALYSVRDH